ncbi:hypothetical protein EDF75_3802 [Raoultella sp. BIGb0149]|uniref:hypothetical protein n=1 Tax=Raoultella sp. BIGb0149 TaxID=2485116 RepID=UPI00106069AF|nr:hypothetical protein [Raoultella sp. BIGb0149]TDQ21634.1 hypothetical protein EDF75_3802 [Raoultella sp. BIGb0149]
MEASLTVLGMLFFMFLVLATAVEAILEMFRGMLESVGITFLKGKYSVEDVLKLSNDISSDNAGLNSKIALVKSAAQQLGGKVKTEIDQLKKLDVELSHNVNNKEKVTAELGIITAEIKKRLEASESTRIFILRTLSAIIGCLIVWKTHFYILEILTNTPSSQGVKSVTSELNNSLFNILVGGLGAAAGSSYWHDQLDRIRDLKALSRTFSK